MHPAQRSGRRIAGNVGLHDVQAYSGLGKGLLAECARKQPPFVLVDVKFDEKCSRDGDRFELHVSPPGFQEWPSRSVRPNRGRQLIAPRPLRASSMAERTQNPDAH